MKNVANYEEVQIIIMNKINGNKWKNFARKI